MQKMKKYAKIALGTAMALVPTIVAKAAPLTAPDLFGGQTAQTNFQGTTGLGSKDLRQTIAGIINVVMGFLGIVAVVIILIGGFIWMTAGGNEEKVKKAKALIFQGIIGLVIILASYAIATFVISSLVTATV
jgi:hypothetical protein